MKDVEEMAYAFAKALNDKEIRFFVKGLQDLSKNKEKILEASTLFNRKIFNNKKGDYLYKIMGKYLPANQRRVFINKIKNMDYGLFDVYFPFVNHRADWEPKNNELYVAAINSCLAKGTQQITAFNIKGKKIMLDPKREPIIPTLVICPSEKYGNYEPYKPPPGWEPKYDHYKVNLKMVYVEHQYDGGFCGEEMELQVKSRVFYDATSSWSNWFIVGNYDVLPFSAKTMDDNFIDLKLNDYHFVLNVWEIDDWMCGNDDEVATVPWDDLLDYSVYTPHWTAIDHNIEKINYLTPRIQRVQNDQEWSGNNVQLEFKMEYFYY